MNTADYGIYEARVSIELVRKIDRYNSETVSKIDLTEMFPAESDYTAGQELGLRVNEALKKSTGIIDARIVFDNSVRALTTGTDSDVLEG